MSTLYGRGNPNSLHVLKRTPVTAQYAKRGITNGIYHHRSLSIDDLNKKQLKYKLFILGIYTVA